jgi:hypothetical protein
MDTRRTTALAVKTRIKAGGVSAQHNRARALRINAGVKAGGVTPQHNRALRVA